MRNWPLLSCCLAMFLISGSFSVIKPFAAAMGRRSSSTGFLFQRTVAISQRTCSCSTTSSCSCCQSVTLLLRGVARNLCVNFNYTQTGLSMTIALGSNTIRYVSIIDYRAFKVCTSVPDCLHSFVCVDVMELSQFPRSITICMQLDIMSKTENWLINYNCISIATLNSTATMPAMPGGTAGTGQTGQMPTGQMPAGQMPLGQMPAGQMPTGQMPAGQMPTGQMPAGQMPPGQMPGGQMPTGQMPVGQMPTGQMPAGQMSTGQMPAGQMPQGPMPTGQFSGGQMPTGQFSARQMPPGQLVSGGDRTAVLRSSRRIPGFLNWISSKKSREMRPAVRKIKSRSNIRKLRPVRNRRTINISPINEISKDIMKEEGQLLENQTIHSNRYSSAIKFQFRKDFDSSRVASEDDLSIRLNRRARRNINKQSNSAMKMQVILRSRKNRIPKLIGNNPKKSFKASANYPASIRSSRIVNQDTISIPMSEQGLRNVIIMDSPPSNNALIPVRNKNKTELSTLRPISASPSYGFPVPPPILVLEDGPSIDVPILPKFPVSYDNRTSSFPDRMPPSFGIASRIGPIGQNKWLQSFDRSVEELETVGPRIQLHPNSKISEMTTTDFSDGTIIFPE